MNNKTFKETLANWSLPLFILFVVMVALVIRFLVSTSQMEQTEVEKHLQDTLRHYAEEITKRTAVVEGEGTLAAEMDCRVSQISTDLSEVVLNSVSQAPGTYMTLICRKTGAAIYQMAGEEEAYNTEIGRLSYFKTVCAGGKRVLFLDNDGIVGHRAVAVVTPVELMGIEFKYLVQYMEVSSLEDIFANYDMGGENIVLLVNSKNQVLMMSGRQMANLEQSNKVSDLEGWLCDNMDIDQADVQILEKKMTDEKTGVIYATTPTRDLALVYTPVGVGDSYLITVLDNTYVEKLVGQQWKPIKNMVIQSGIAVLAFLGSILAITIITYLRDNQKKEELSAKADTDLLTDLNNKLATETKIKKYMREHPGQQAMMFVLDIDNFKKINDTMGHAFGDQVLRELGNNLPAQFRATDIIGRTGGDEFTLFLKDIRDDEIAKKEAKKVLYFFRNFQAGGYVKYSATASIGVAMYPRDGADFETLYKSADNALYVAKKRGKNQLAFFGEAAEEQVDIEEGEKIVE